MVNCTHAPPEAHSDAGVAGAGVCSAVLSCESRSRTYPKVHN